MTRAPVKLSREMKVLLGLLLLVAAISLWYFLTSQRSGTDDLTATQPPVTADPGATVPVTPTPEGTENEPTGVQPDGQVDVEVIPPFPTEAAPDPDAAPEDVPPTPGGINPDTALASVPGSNPFRPLAVNAQDQGNAGGTTPVATTPVPGPVATTPTPQPTPNVTPITSTGGALGLSPVAGSAGDSSGSSSGPIPVPQIPGGNGQTSAGSGPVDVIPLPTVDGPVVVGGPGTGANGAGGTASGANSSNAGGTNNSGANSGAPAPRPPAPPVAGVSVPSVTRLPSATPVAPGADAPGTSPSGAPGVNGAAGSGTSPATATPTPGTPQVITDLSAPPAAGGTAAPTNALDTFVQTQQLAFNAVVLGPVNTAIFRSKDGFVVVSVGQTLPDTQVTVKEVTATGATLSLGNNTTTLELEKR